MQIDNGCDSDCVCAQSDCQMIRVDWGTKRKWTKTGGLL